MLKNYSIAIAVMFMWALGTPLSKIGVSQIPPLFFNFMRYVIVAAVLVPFVPRPSMRHWRQIGIMAVLFCFMHSGLLMLSLTEIDASLAVVLGRTGVVFAAIFSYFLLNEKLTPTKFAGISTALAGTFIMAGSPTLSGQYWYVLAILISYISWGLFNIFLKKRNHEIAYLTLIGWGGLFSLPLLLGLSLAFESAPWQYVMTANYIPFIAILYTSTVGIILTYVLYQRLIHLMPVNELAAFTLLVPVFGVGISVTALHETLTPHFIVGGLFTLLGIFLTTVARQVKGRKRQEEIPIED